MKNKSSVLLAGLFAGAMVLLYFYKVINPDLYFIMGDSPLHSKHFISTMFPHSLKGIWDYRYLTGFDSAAINLAVLWLFDIIFTPEFSTKYLIVLYLMLSGIFMFIYIRSKFSSFPVSLFCAAAYAFAPIGFSLIYPGHVGKFDVLLWVPLIFYFTEKIFTGRKIVFSMLTGLAIGFMFINGTTDTAFFFTILFSCYYLFLLRSLIKKKITILTSGQFTRTIVVYTGLFFLIAGLAVFASWQSLAINFRTGIKGVTQGSSDSPEQKWNWATQWSLPPVESAEFFIPGLFGLITSDQDYPYWGAIGRDPEHYKAEQKNFSNFNLTNNYLGYPVFFFLLLTLFAFKKNQEIFFWLAASALIILMAWGRHFPLYRLFYSLPYMSTFRNPNKFLHLFHFTAVILSGHGLIIFRNSLTDINDQHFLTLKKYFFRWLVVLAVLLPVMFYTRTLVFNMLYFPLGADFAGKAAENFTGYFLRFAVINIMVFIIIHICGRLRPLGGSQMQILFAVLLVMLAIDQYSINRHYLKTAKFSDHKRKDDLVNFFLNDKELYRIKFLSRGPYLNYLLQGPFPYNNLQTPDAPSLSRYPQDLSDFYGKVPNNDLLQLRLMNVKYILANSPFTHPLAEFLTGFRVSEQENVYLFRVKDYAQRIYLSDRIIFCTNENDALDALNRPFAINKDAVIISQKQNDYLPETGTLEYSIENISYRAVDIDINLKTSKACFLIFHDRFHTGWKAYVDGRETPVHRANFLFRGVQLPAGARLVQMKYRPSSPGFYFSVIAWIMFFSLLVFSIKGSGATIRNGA